jgi:hypothetical protein
MSAQHIAFIFLAAVSLGLGLKPTRGFADAAQEKQTGAKQTPSSLDEQLLEGLDSALLDDLDQDTRKKNTPGESEAKSSAGAPNNAKDKVRGKNANALDEQLLEELGRDEQTGSAQARDPLIDVQRRMKTVASRLADEKLDAQTTQLQQKIRDDLAALLEECKKQCQGGGSSSGKPGSKPGKGSQGSQAGKSPAAQAPTDAARDSSEKLRDRNTQRPERGALTGAMKASWGHLPERAREQLSNTNTDAFLPKYELLLEKYFKRLAETDSNE